MRLLACLLIVLACAVCVCAQTASFGGPNLGFVSDPAGTTLRPILGVPGASTIGPPVGLGAAIRGAVISPKHDYVMARSGEADAVVFFQLSVGAAFQVVDGIRPDVVAISPAGSAAAFYNHDAKTLEILEGMPQSARVAWRFDASVIAGRLVRMAVSDDGILALLNFADAGARTLWLIDRSGALRRLSSIQPAVFTFVENRHDAVVADEGARQVYVFRDIDGAASRIPLLPVGSPGGFTAVAASADARRVFIAREQAGGVTIVNLDGFTSVTIPCGCRPTGLHPLKGAALFRLTEPSTDPMTILDASTSPPRTLVIPPSVWGTKPE